MSSIHPPTTVLRVFAILITVLVAALQTNTGAVTSTTGKSFFYWLNGSFLNEHADHVNVTFWNNPANMIQELQALPADLKMVVPAFYVLAANGCSLNPNWHADWSGAATLMTPYLNRIAAVLITDEPDLNAIGNPNCYPGVSDPLQRQFHMVQLMEQASSVIKNTVPGWTNVKTWVNYGPTFGTAGAPVAQNVDWNSFDCYGPFNNCGGTGFSIPQLVDIFASRLPNPQTQSIFLVSDATCFLYDQTGRKTHESELFIRALEYWQLAVTHPRVNGVVGFMWGGGTCTFLPPADPINVINNSPGLSAIYRHIGLNLLTGALPSISALSVPTECVIPVGGATCAINVSWTMTSGPNLRLFGRLVGNPDVFAGPLCPGATSCSIPAGVGDYIFELRENADPNSKLIFARQTEVRHGTGAPTGQITFTPSTCKKDTGGNCLVALTANVQNAPFAGFFLVGSPYPVCAPGRTNLCTANGASIPVGGPYSFTAQLRANGNDPNSPLLEQRTFPLTVTP